MKLYLDIFLLYWTMLQIRRYNTENKFINNMQERNAVKIRTVRNTTMQKSILKKLGAMVLASILATGLLAGCGNETSKDEGTGEEEQREVVVALIGMVPQWQYEDENGELTGFEVELLREIDDLLPQYTFTFEKHDFSDSLISVENKKADISVCQWQENDERKGRFLFSHAYQKSEQIITVDSDNEELVESIQSIADLAGKTVRVPEGNSGYYALLAYNEANPDAQIIIDTTAASNDILIADFKANLIDAYVIDEPTKEQINKNYDIELVAVGEPVTQELARFALNLDDEQLLEDINNALETLRDNGRLSELAVEFIGYDISAGITAED